MGRLNDIVNGDGELTNKETAEILKILLADYYLINPDAGTIIYYACDKEGNKGTRTCREQ